MAAIEAKREELSATLSELDAALEHTLPQRVAGPARDGHPSPAVSERLGPLPQAEGQRAVWCALAAEVERFYDRHPGRDPYEEESAGKTRRCTRTP